MSPIKRRLLTRALAIIPAVSVLLYAGENGVLQLLVLSQVVLSLQLPFAIVPLIRFTSSTRIMGEFVSPTWLKRLACGAALMIIGLNAWLVMQALAPSGAGAGRFAIGLLAALCSALLCWVAFAPLRFTRQHVPADTNR
jgi:manganese transport protein